MNWDEIRQSFNRALERTFSWIKVGIVFSVLALCGLLGVFCKGVAPYAGQWLVMSLTFVPILITAGILLALGILLIRIYHHEIKNLPVNVWELLGKSWELMIAATYFSLPLILTYLMFWMVLGVFFLLREIPGLGTAIGVLLAPGPFLLNLGAILLCVLHVAILFFIAPALALKSGEGINVLLLVKKRLQKDPFTNIVWIAVALFPLAFVGSLLTLAAGLTESWYFEEGGPVYAALQWFFIMLPYTALFSPAVVFFFQFAAESHVALQREMKREES